MITQTSSVESVLDGILVKLEYDDNNKVPKNSIKRKLEESFVINKRRKLSLLETVEVEEETFCRVCYDPSPRLPIIYPCKCKGTMGAIHLKCLERWLEESNRNSCELCGHQFQVERTPRYRVLQSLFIWLCLNQRQHQLYVRSLKADLLRCLIVTPITIACSYICVVAADFYAKNNYDNFPPARWTTYSLLTMMSLIILSYFVWMYMAIQYHHKVWFYWWQKTSTVKIIFNSENIPSINDQFNVSYV